MAMRTVFFRRSGLGIHYECTSPGDQSGQYVDKSTATEAVDALDELVKAVLFGDPLSAQVLAREGKAKVAKFRS